METIFNFYNKYKYIFIIGSILLLVVVLGYIYFSNNEQEVTDEPLEILTNEENEVEDLDGSIKVNIKGAVKNPGVYELESNSRVEDAIDISGGLSDNADTSIINLSKKLFDESVIIIYTKEEVKKIKQGNVVIQYIENECNCPSFENNACIDPDTLVNSDSGTTVDELNGKISINKATIKELQTLSGIGEAKAKSIIEYREINGSFKTIEEIKNVKGIGDAIFEKIKDNITV